MMLKKIFCILFLLSFCMIGIANANDGTQENYGLTFITNMSIALIVIYVCCGLMILFTSKFLLHILWYSVNLLILASFNSTNSSTGDYIFIAIMVLIGFWRTYSDYSDGTLD